MSGIYVPMTPDRTVLWEKHQTPEGDLLVHPNDARANAAAQLILNYAAAGTEPDTWQRCNEGTEGIVYQAADVAVKAFQYNTPNAGLNALRANVTFETAIARYEHPQYQSVVRKLVGNSCQHPDLTFTTPTMYAAFLPHEESDALPIWAMSYEQGQVPKTVDRTAQVRARHYRNALSTCGADKSQISFDDRKGNMLARPNTLGGWEVVKFDVRGSVNPVVAG